MSQACQPTTPPPATSHDAGLDPGRPGPGVDEGRRDPLSPLTIAIYRSESDADPEVATVTWPRLVELLTRHRRGAKSGEAWSPVRYDPGARRASANVRAVTAIVLDVDHDASNAAWLDGVLAAGLAGVVHSTWSHTAASPSLRLVLRASREVMPGEWPRVLRHVVGAYGIPADPACKDFARLYYVPSARDDAAEVVAEVLPGELAVDVDAILAAAPVEVAPVEPSAPRELPMPRAVADDARDRAVARLVAEMPDRGRHLISRRLAGALAHGGWSSDDIEMMLVDVLGVAIDAPGKRAEHARRAVDLLGAGERVEGWPSLVEGGHYSEETVREVRAWLGMPAAVLGSEEVTAFVAEAMPLAQTLAPAATLVGAGEPPPGEMDCGRDGRPRPSASNVRLALRELGVRVAYDEMGERRMITLGDRTVPIQDHHHAMLRVAMDQKYGLAIGRDILADVIDVESRAASYHPVRSYLDGLEWDGTPRIDEWLIRYASADDSPFVRAVSRIVLVAAVRRVRTPGAKYDEMVVLEGAQGCGKSTLWSTMAVSESWYTDALVLDGGDPRRAIEATAGRWIVEVAELGGMSRGAIDEVKAYLSRREDSARLAYGRETTIRPRTFVLVGSTNDSQYLSDPTGARRFWPVSVGAIDLPALAEVRAQLWAEAAHAEAAGESIRLDPALYSDASTEQEARRVVDSWEEILARELDGVAGRIHTADVWRILGLDPARARVGETRRLAGVMRQLGWAAAQARDGKRMTRHYVRMGAGLTEWLRLEGMAVTGWRLVHETAS